MYLKTTNSAPAVPATTPVAASGWFGESVEDLLANKIILIGVAFLAIYQPWQSAAERSRRLRRWKRSVKNVAAKRRRR
jgi:hypothetical protein